MPLMEDEAKTKWCPLAMVAQGLASATTQPVAVNRVGNDLKCIGSACCLWQPGNTGTSPCGLANK